MSTRSVMSSGPDGKDLVIVAPREELMAPSSVKLPEPEPTPGLIMPDGSINWGCPCLGGMATGPCGVQFRDAFSCFHYSEADPKGSDCYEKFSVMQECMARYPDLYGRDDDDLAALDARSDHDTADNDQLSADKPALSTDTAPAESPAAGDHK